MRGHLPSPHGRLSAQCAGGNRARLACQAVKWDQTEGSPQVMVEGRRCRSRTRTSSRRQRLDSRQEPASGEMKRRVGCFRKTFRSQRADVFAIQRRVASSWKVGAGKRSQTAHTRGKQASNSSEFATPESQQQKKRTTSNSLAVTALAAKRRQRKSRS